MNMKTAIKTVVAATLLATCVHAEEESKGFESTVIAGVDFASAYVFHGMTYNSNPCLQPYVVIEGLPIVLTMWGNYNLENDTSGFGEFEGGRLTEWDYFFTLPLPFEFAVMDLTYGMYTYPDIGWEADQELQFGISKPLGELPVEPFFRAGLMIDGPLKDTLYLEGGVRGSFGITEKLSGNYLARFAWEDQAGAAGTEQGFKDMLLTLGAEYAFVEQAGLTCSINYAGQLDDEVLPDALYDVDFFATVGAYIAF